MSFLRVHNLMNFVPPGRLYDHSAGNEVFSNDQSSVKYLLGQYQWLSRKELDYFIAISWEENGEKVLDIFGYIGVSENWKANPGIKNWVVKNGVVIYDTADTEKEITCEDGGILIGKEGEYRRKTKSLEEYLGVPLDIEWINRILRGE